MKDGVVYVFVQDHPAGAWDPTHVMATNITTQMELMPDKIVTYVGSQGYGRTFISLTDPALDPANEVRAGDYWIKQDPNVGTWRQASSRTWGDLKEETWYDITNQTSGKWRNVFKKTWGEIKNQTWYDLIDKTAEMYCRKGSADKGEWIPVNDTNAISEAYTRIQQTADAIIQEAHRANAAEGVLDSRIIQTAESITQEVRRANDAEGVLSSRIVQTAESITQEVRRATSAEEQLSSTIVQTAESITQSVQRTYMEKTEAYPTVDTLVNKSIQLADDAATSAKNASIARTDRYQSASAIVESAIAVVDSTSLSNLPDFSVNTQYYKGDTVKYNGKSYIFTTSHKGAWNDAHVKEIKPYIAQTTTYQTADKIYSEAVKTSATNMVQDFSDQETYKVGDIVRHNGIIYKFTQAHPAGAWNAAHATVCTDTSDIIAKTTISQTADHIYLSAKSYADGKYTIQSGITIASTGIEISGAKYLKLVSGAYIEIAASQIHLGNNNDLATELGKKSNISTMTAEYYVSTSATTTTGGSWSTTVPTHQDNKYIWTRTKTTYSDGSDATYTPAICTEGVKGDPGQSIKGDPGDPGDPGVGISSIVTKYKAHYSYSVDPEVNKTAEQIEADWLSAWSTLPPAQFDATNRYLWTWTRQTMTNGTKYDTRISEYGVNASYDLADNARTLANNIINGTNNTKAMYTKNISNTGVTVDDTTLHVTASGNMYVDSGGALIIRSTQTEGGQPLNAVVMNSTGIAIATGGNLSVSATNFDLDSSATKLSIGNFTFNENGFIYTRSDTRKFIFGGSHNGSSTVSPDAAIYLMPMSEEKSNTTRYSTHIELFASYYSGHSSTTSWSGKKTNGISFGMFRMINPDGTTGADVGKAWVFRPALPPGSGEEFWLGLPLNTNFKWDYSFISNMYYYEMYNPSSREFKHDIVPISSYGEVIDKLEPVSFAYNYDKNNKKRIGLIYEDTVKIIPEICGNANDARAINYVELVPILLKEIQCLRKRIAKVETT